MKSPPPSASARKPPPSNVTSSASAVSVCHRACTRTHARIPKFSAAGNFPAALRFWEHTMSLKERVTEDMKAAMRAKDSERLSVVRLLLAAIKQREVDE